METKDILLIAVLGVALWFVVRQRQAQAQQIAGQPNLTNTITGAVGAGSTLLRNASGTLTRTVAGTASSALSWASHNAVAAAAIAPPLAATSAIIHPISTVKSVGNFIGSLW